MNEAVERSHVGTSKALLHAHAASAVQLRVSTTLALAAV